MARQKGTLVLSANFEIKAAAPLDSRYTVQTEADLTASASWVADGLAYLYKGMQVYVINSNKLYMLIDEDYTKMSSWIELSGIPASCLSYKGDVATFNDLPDTELTTGDVYYVEDEVVNYYWDGDSWKALGSPDKSSFIWKCSTALNPIPTNTNVLISNLKRIDDNTITCTLDDLKVGKTIISDNSGMLGVVIGTTKTTTDNDTAVIATLTESDYYKKDEIDDLLDLKADKATTYTKTEVDGLLDNKVDKEAGKGLSTNDFTDAYKDKLDDLENYDDTEVRNLIDTKVDKVAGKQLSTEDYTTAEKEKLASLENYDDTEILAELDNKVDKVPGKQLSTEDYTTAEKTKLAGIEEGAQVNKLEKIKLNGVDISIDPLDKSSNIVLPIAAEYTIAEVTTTTGYAKSYQLKKDDDFVGVKIDIPKDLVVESGEIKIVTTEDEPYEGAHVGDKYIDLTLNDPNEDHIYIPVNSLVDAYNAGNGINIDNNTISIKLNPNNTNGLNVNSNGLGLNTVTELSAGAMTPQDKIKLNSLENYDDTAIQAALQNKVDKEAGKGLSSNDFTDALKQKLEEAVAYDDTAIRNLIALKVDKETGKGLSANDFTDAYKEKLDSLDNYDDSQVRDLIDGKVEKINGKGLSANDFTDAYKEKLDGIEAGAEVNTIETVKVNGVALEPDANRVVDVLIPTYTVVENEQRPGYAKTYNLTKDGVPVGATIEIPENSIIKSGDVETVTVVDEPYEGARIGDKYIDLELDSDPVSHVYIPLKDLIVGYTGGNGITISGANQIMIRLDPNNSNGLVSTDAGLGLNLATVSTPGAMSAADKYKLNNLSNYDDTQVRNLINNKVDKEAGKGLSTNDYTDAEKTKLAGIQSGAQVNNIEGVRVNGTVLTPDATKVVSLTVPTKVSDLTNDLNFLSDANYVHTDNNFTNAYKEKLEGLSEYDDSELRALIEEKQDELISGTNIKTINNQSLLGSGNIEIEADANLSETMTTNITVGWCESGTTFAAGTPLENILRAILVGSGPTPTTNWTVSFNTYGGSTIASQIVEDGNTATRPTTDPTKSGYTFDNWYTTSSYTTLFNFNNAITADTVVHAKWDAIPVTTYTVTFNTNGGSAIASQTVEEGQKATRPTTAPTKSGYTFDDWYTDTTYATKFNFNNTITGDTTIYANWNPVVVTHTVTFYDMSGGIITTQTVNDGAKATRPTDPTPPTGYVFDNWYTTNTYTTAFNFNTAITADTPIYAKFVEEPQPTEIYDIYLGGLSKAQCANKTAFAALADSTIIANIMDQHKKEESTEPFMIQTTFGTADTVATDNSIFYVLLKDGITPTGGKIISGGITSTFAGSAVTNPNDFTCVHTDITINGNTYHVYGKRTRWNSTDRVGISIA